MRRRATMVLTSMMCSLASSVAMAQTILRVDASAPPGGDGLSWETAFQHPQEALDARPGGPVEIWVAQGVYLPVRRSDPTDPRSAGLGMQNGYALFGGFAGHEVNRAERDLLSNPTILSGDLGEPGDRSDNAYSVVRASRNDRTAVLDGFIVRDGYADVTPGRGGGLLAESTALVVRHCVFEENASSQEGSAIYAAGGFAAPTFIDCTIRDSAGGAVMLSASGTLVVRCRFERNSGRIGGAVILSGGAHRLIDCVFEDNDAVGGAALLITRAQWVDLIGCRVQRNTSEGHGGAIVISEGREVVIDRCIVSENTSLQGDGGGLYVGDSMGPTWVLNSHFTANSAEGAGGAIAGRFEGGGIIGCVLADNVARQGGGASLNPFEPTPVIACTVTRNRASHEGGGLYLNTPASSPVFGSIIWGNEDAAGAGEASQVRAASGTPLIHWSCIQGWSGSWPGVGNMDDDPAFADPSGGNFRLSSASPCIDAGHNNIFPSDFLLDFDRAPRFVDDPLTPDTGFGQAPIVDMGAFEFQAAARLLVLSITGRCPPAGPMLLTWAGAQPGAPVVVLYASQPGQVVIPGGYACEGTTLGLSGARLTLLANGVSDGSGGRTLSVIVNRRACGGVLQAVNLRTCATSNVERLD